jgi:hypothetical protein
MENGVSTFKVEDLKVQVEAAPSSKIMGPSTNTSNQNKVVSFHRKQ